MSDAGGLSRFRGLGDEELIRLASAPDPGPFEVLYERHHARMVVLDLRELSLMDCAGVHVIVDASVRVKQARRRLVLVRGPSQVDRVFTLAGAADVVEIGDLGPAGDAPVPARLPRATSTA